LSYESEKLLAKLTGKKIEDAVDINKDELPKHGKERETIVRVRINQDFFRRAVLAAYNRKCCITELAIPELLNASHIKPWSKDILNRVNPRNGLCLNVLHDRAFDRGLITVTPEYNIKTSKLLNKYKLDEPVKEFLLRYNGKRITMPNRFLPGPSFLRYHNKRIFEN
ncbi:MAG: HNH endonuclease, partial [Bacteroidota bacterium]